MLPKARAPSWVLSGARYDFDFANNRYWGGTGIYLGQSGGAGSRGSMLVGGPINATANTVFRPDINGIYRTFPLNSPCITPGRGLWAEETTTNYALQCRDFTNASWTLTSMTATKTGVLGADNSTGSASRLTATGNNATALQAITLTSRALVSSVLIKRVTGSGVISITQDNGGTYTDITSQLNTSAFVLVQLPVATLANPTVGVQLATSGDVIDIDFWQTESTTTGFPTTRLLTTTATRTRAGGSGDSPSFGTDATNFNNGVVIVLDTYFNTPVSCLSIASGNGVPGCRLKGGGDVGVTIMSSGSNGGPASFGSASIGTVAISTNSGVSAGALGAAGLGPINKVVGRMRGNGCDITLNGGAIASGTSFIAIGGPDSHMGCGNNAAGQFALNGYTSRLTIWNRELTNGEMIQYSTLGTINGL